MFKMNEEEYEKYFKHKMKRQEDFYQAFELGAFGDDLPKLAEDEVNKIVKTEWEYNKLQNNWNELKKWLEEEHNKNISWYGSLTHHDKQYYLYKFGTTKDVLDNVQDKMQELEQGKDE